MATTSAPPPAPGAAPGVATTSAPPPVPGAAPGEDIVIRGVTWPKLIAVIGSVLAVACVGIYLLLGVVYGGLQERFDALGKRVQGLDDNFHGAVSAGISVKDLTEKAPRIEQTINDTRTDVATIKAQVAAAQTDVSSIKQQLQTVQQGINQVQVSLAGIEPVIQRLQTVLTTPIGGAPASTAPPPMGASPEDRTRRR